MKIRRIFVEDLRSQRSEIRLPEGRSRYVARVLRMRTGDPLHVFDGRGGEYAATISSVAKSGVTLEVSSPVSALPPSPCAITLVQGISRGERMDYTLQKATELGVHDVRVCFTERSEVRLSGKRLESRLDHWRGVVVSAAEQCGRADVPNVCLVSDFVSASEAAVNRWILDGAAQCSLKKALRVHGGDSTTACTLAVGPEGGWTASEVRAAVSAGWSAVAMGPRVLRSETAGPAAITMIQAVWGDW